MRKWMWALATVWLGVCAGSSQAGIMTTSGDVQVIASPADVSAAALESNLQIRAFAEQQAVTLGDDVDVDITDPSTVPVPDGLSPGVISQGTLVDSFLLHFDPIGFPSEEDVIDLSGSITFDQDVLGIITDGDKLVASDVLAGLGGTTYEGTGSVRKLEVEPGNIGSVVMDVVTLSADRRTVTVDLSAGPNMDELRILTVAVPEPTTLGLLVLGLFMWCGHRLRRT